MKVLTKQLTLKASRRSRILRFRAQALGKFEHLSVSCITYFGFSVTEKMVKQFLFFVFIIKHHEYMMYRRKGIKLKGHLAIVS